VAWGIGAFLLARLSEAIEYRKDHDFSVQANQILVDEYIRVREGLNKLREEVEQKG
jgi:hypothetical protein